MHIRRIAEHNLVPAHEDEGGRQPFQVAEDGGGQGIFGVGGVAPGIKLQLLYGHVGVNIPVGFVGLARGGQIRPGGHGNEPAGKGQVFFFQLEAQGVH